MSTCNIDHSTSEVTRKLHSQREFLPASLFEFGLAYLQREPSQNELNELFHLLKKYDLIPNEEQEARNACMTNLISKRGEIADIT